MMWLNFYDPDRPEGSRLLGAVVVRQDDFLEAALWTIDARLNPGKVTIGYDVKDVPPQYVGRLLPPSEAELLARFYQGSVYVD